MRSSTLYGPVTKVTAGKYFVQEAKGVDKMREKVGEVKDTGKEKEVGESGGKNEGTDGKKQDVGEKCRLTKRRQTEKTQ